MINRPCIAHGLELLAGEESHPYSFVESQIALTMTSRKWDEKKKITSAVTFNIEQARPLPCDEVSPVYIARREYRVQFSKAIDSAHIEESKLQYRTEAH
ncbi:hypothetical protein RRG08_045008 [Elysia crispata]|uniref:Uncharacterized protein n=1 Tax=Elysia crispata TaxID=231223 RepID=A0AAE1CS15_9GAST|nr:hypothetical protein RRG08_045008 [Elysia crispata]